MKFYKTNNSRRSTYTYKDAMGHGSVLKPNEPNPVTGEIISPEWIALLHRMDDREVRNNIKNCIKPVEKWEKELLREWKAANPGRDLPDRVNFSLDAVGTDGKGNRNSLDKGNLLSEVSLMACRENKEIEQLREAVELLEPQQQELYRRIVINGERVSEIAAEQHVGVRAIGNRMARIRTSIRRNYEVLNLKP